MSNPSRLRDFPRVSAAPQVLRVDAGRPRRPSSLAMQILRHSKIAITMEIYTEVVSSATRDAPGKLGDQFGP